ncbi:MAG: hypothetical protein TU35_001985 [Thermoproteus sp. AZ2]|uniref:Uncharacterized protein n=1 Tax=Thermoproteus sp. AZ2 TaxID=1609232 RepID=A0ACC6UZ90_9CREN
MMLAALLIGLAAGAALLLARLMTEEERPEGYGYLHYFIVVGTAADIYAAYAIAASPALTIWSAAALGLLASSLALIVHMSVRPGARDFELALLACAPYIYLFALYAASLALGWPSIWPPY